MPRIRVAAASTSRSTGAAPAASRPVRRKPARPGSRSTCPTPPHEVTVTAAGNGEVRLFDAWTSIAAQAGVVVDTLGINGAQIFTPLRWSESCFAEHLAHAAPDLVILAYAHGAKRSSRA